MRGQALHPLSPAATAALKTFTRSDPRFAKQKQEDEHDQKLDKDGRRALLTEARDIGIELKRWKVKETLGGEGGKGREGEGRSYIRINIISALKNLAIIKWGPVVICPTCDSIHRCLKLRAPRARSK